MRAARSVGRTVGVLMLVQMVGGMLVNFVLLRPVFTTPPGFIVNAAANSLQVGFTALLGIVMGALSVGIAIAVWPVVRQLSHAMALWLLVLAVVALSLSTVENIAMMSMLSFSQSYAKAAAAEAALFETLRVVVASARNWAHYVHALFGGGMFLVLYGLLYRFGLVPRALAALGLAAIALQMTAVAMPLFGQRIVLPMLMPMALTHLALALWLTVKGFEERPRPVPAGVSEAALGERL